MKILLIRKRYNDLHIHKCRCKGLEFRKTNFCLGNRSNTTAQAGILCGNSWMLSALGLLGFSPVGRDGSVLVVGATHCFPWPGPWNWAVKPFPSFCLALCSAGVTWIHTGLQEYKLTLSEPLHELEKVNTNCSFAQAFWEPWRSFTESLWHLFVCCIEILQQSTPC